MVVEARERESAAHIAEEAPVFSRTIGCGLRAMDTLHTSIFRAKKRLKRPCSFFPKVKQRYQGGLSSPHSLASAGNREHSEKTAPAMAYDTQGTIDPSFTNFTYSSVY